MFSIEADFDRAERLLSDIALKQLPFATAMALNDTAEVVQRAEEADIAVTFDRPTPFTKKGLYLRRASKNRLMATVGVKRVQAEYLKRQVTGGRRLPKRSAIVVPVKARLNAYGNLPKGSLRRSVGKPKVFATKRGGAKTGHLPGGVYERTGKGGRDLKMLVGFEPSANYRRRWKFEDLALRRARATFRPAFLRRLQRAIETAR